MDKKVKQFIETHKGKCGKSDGTTGVAKFSTEQEATNFMYKLECKGVCCGPEMSDFTIVKFHEDHLGRILA